MQIVGGFCPGCGSKSSGFLRQLFRCKHQIFLFIIEFYGRDNISFDILISISIFLSLSLSFSVFLFLSFSLCFFFFLNFVSFSFFLPLFLYFFNFFFFHFCFFQGALPSAEVRYDLHHWVRYGKTWNREKIENINFFHPADKNMK